MKKTKLFLSLCMMCLCVAVLCMGILAAGSATYQINGNISYNMIDGVARINTRVYKVAGDPASENDLQTAVTGTFLTTSSFAEIEANQSPIYAQTYQNKETLEYTDTPTTKDYDINVVYGANNDAGAYYTYYVVIQIYNQTETWGYVLNASITNTDKTEIVSTDSSYVATNTSVSNIAKNTFSNIVVGISAQTIEKAQALTNSTESFAYTLTVTYVENPTIVSVQTYMYSTDVGSDASTYTKASDLRTTAKSMETDIAALSGTKISSATTEFRLGETAKTFSTGSQTIDYSTAKTYWIVSEVKNKGFETAYVKITDSTIDNIGERDFITSGSLIYRSGDIVFLASGETRRLVTCYAQYSSGLSVSSLTCGYSLEIGESDNYSPLKFQPAQTLTAANSNTYSKSAYYYVEMGDFYGLPVRWRMIAESTKDTSGDGVYKYDSAGTTYYKHSSYTSDTIETGSTVNGIFIQETYTSKMRTSISDGDCKGYTERSDGQGLTCCSFNNYKYDKSGSYKYDENGELTEYLANDYYNSKIRQYLTLTGENTIYKYSNGSSNNESGHKSNYLADLNISTDNYVYKNVSARSTSMEMKVTTYSGYNTRIFTETDTDYAQSGEEDKFWLPSVYEMLTWYAGQTTSTSWYYDETEMNNLMIWGYCTTISSQGEHVWFRSGIYGQGGSSWGVWCIGTSFKYGDGFMVKNAEVAARAAFQLSCKA